jgi:hypothetical protein
MPCFFALGLLFFMGVEYTLRMVPSSAPPFDIGFVTTRSLHLLLASSPKLNTLLAALNTVPISLSHSSFSGFLFNFGFVIFLPLYLVLGSFLSWYA